VVTIEFHYMTLAAWLGGRGYTMIQLWWPVTFKGKRDRVTGRFLAVMWEKLAYPIISHWGESIYVAVSAPMVQAHVR
jgi:hypothetical protein